MPKTARVFPRWAGSISVETGLGGIKVGGEHEAEQQLAVGRHRGCGIVTGRVGKRSLNYMPVIKCKSATSRSPVLGSTNSGEM